MVHTLPAASWIDPPDPAFTTVPDGEVGDWVGLGVGFCVGGGVGLVVGFVVGHDPRGLVLVPAAGDHDPSLLNHHK